MKHSHHKLGRMFLSPDWLHKDILQKDCFPQQEQQLMGRKLINELTMYVNPRGTQFGMSFALPNNLKILTETNHT
jgi:hypothetical protein